VAAAGPALGFGSDAMRRRQHEQLTAVLDRLRIVREQHNADLRELVRQAIGAGAPSHQVAEVLGISRATLWRRFREELRTGAQQAVIASTGSPKLPTEVGLAPLASNASVRNDRSITALTLHSAPTAPTSPAEERRSGWMRAASRARHAPLSAKPCSRRGARPS